MTCFYRPHSARARGRVSNQPMTSDGNDDVLTKTTQIALKRGRVANTTMTSTIAMKC